MRVLLAELAPVLGEFGPNLARIEEVVRAAASDLAVFPELYLSGYRVGDRFHRVAIDPGGPVGERLDAIAKAHRTAIAVGGPVRSPERPGEVLNAVLFATPDGPIQVQAKRFLPTFGPFEEGAIFSASEAGVPIRLGPMRLGVQICYDAFFPEVSRELAVGGAGLLVIVSAAPITSRALFEKVLPARAVENACPLVYVNRVGVEDGLVFGGGSVALDARGERLAERPVPLPSLGKGERLFVAEIDPGSGDRWRPFRPVLRDISGRRAGATARPPSGGPAAAR